MLITALAVLTLSTVIVPNIQQVLGAPDFKTVECGDVKGLRRANNYDLCLEVDYEIDKEDDILLLHKVNGQDTVFEGRLLKEKSRVSVSVEDASDPDDVEVVFHSKHSPGNAFFKASLKGKRKSAPIVFPAKDKNGVSYLDTALKLPSASNNSRPIASLTTSSLTLPSAGFRLNVHVFYDDSFNTRFGAAATTRIQAIFSIVKTIYSDSSLTTVIEPNVIDITYRSGQTWTATGATLNSVSQSISNSANSDGNAYVYLCSENDAGGVVGIAWLSGTCDATRFGRSSINEYLSNDAVTAQIVAHEIGHNLGMEHDFGSGGTSDNRVSSTGQACTNVGGYMDYQPNPTKWSPCSVEDFTKYYNSVNPWCLSSLTTTTVAPTTAAPTTAAPTTAAPTTAAPTTAAPTTAAPTTAAPTTVAPTTAVPTTVAPTTAAPTTVAPTTAAPTTAAPTTVAPTTAAPTTAAPTTAAPTTAAPTTAAPTTAAPTTAGPTTAAPTTAAPTTAVPTTAAPTTVAPTTVPPEPPVDCFAVHRVSYGLNLGQGPFSRDVESSYDCQKLCQSESTCKYFVYDTRRNRRWCWLKTGQGRVRWSFGRILGPRTCDGCETYENDRVSFCEALSDFLSTGCQLNRWVRRFCPKTCRICKPKCTDRLSTNRCRRLRRRCRRSYRVRRYCPKTCGSC